MGDVVDFPGKQQPERKTPWLVRQLQELGAEVIPEAFVERMEMLERAKTHSYNSPITYKAIDLFTDISMFLSTARQLKGQLEAARVDIKNLKKRVEAGEYASYRANALLMNEMQLRQELRNALGEAPKNETEAWGLKKVLTYEGWVEAHRPLG